MNGTKKSTKKLSLNSNQLVIALSVLLIGQLLLTCTVFMAKHPDSGSQSPLLAFNPKKVTKIVIQERPENGSDKDLKRLELEMTPKADWKICGFYDFPASSDMIHQTLDTIAEIKKEQPLGITGDAQDRYQVSAKNFLHAATFFEGTKIVGTIYTGKLLRDNKTAIKSADDSSVYTSIFSNSRLTAAPNYWIDTRAASVKLKKIDSIDMGYFRLDNFDESWNLVEGPRTELLNKDAVQGLVYPIANCKITCVLGTTPDPDFDLEHPFLSFKVRLKDELERSYRISKAKKSGLYILSISGFPWICVANKRNVEKIVSWTPERLRNQQKISKPTGIDLKAMLKKKMQETLDNVSHEKKGNK